MVFDGGIVTVPALVSLASHVIASKAAAAGAVKLGVGKTFAMETGKNAGAALLNANNAGQAAGAVAGGVGAAGTWDAASNRASSSRSTSSTNRYKRTLQNATR